MRRQKTLLPVVISPASPSRSFQMHWDQLWNCAIYTSFAILHVVHLVETHKHPVIVGPTTSTAAYLLSWIRGASWTNLLVYFRSILAASVIKFSNHFQSWSTLGSLVVIMDAPHLKTVLQGFVHPPPVSVSSSIFISYSPTQSGEN